MNTTLQTLSLSSLRSEIKRAETLIARNNMGPVRRARIGRRLQRLRDKLQVINVCNVLLQ